MTAKAPIDENVKFLFACHIRSDYKTIDFTRAAAHFRINPVAAIMRLSKLKKAISVADTASSLLEGKKRRMSKSGRRSPPIPIKVEKLEDSVLPLHSPPAATRVKEEEEVASPEELAPPAFSAGLPKPPKCKRDRAEEQVSIPVTDEAVGGMSRFSATQVPHLPRVEGAVAVEVQEAKSQHPIPEKPHYAPVVQTPPTLKSDLKPQLGEEKEEEKKYTHDELS